MVAKVKRRVRGGTNKGKQDKTMRMEDADLAFAEVDVWAKEGYTRRTIEQLKTALVEEYIGTNRSGLVRLHLPQSAIRKRYGAFDGNVVPIDESASDPIPIVNDVVFYCPSGKCDLSHDGTVWSFTSTMEADGTCTHEYASADDICNIPPSQTTCTTQGGVRFDKKICGSGGGSTPSDPNAPLPGEEEDGSQAPPGSKEPLPTAYDPHVGARLSRWTNSSDPDTMDVGVPPAHVMRRCQETCRNLCVPEVRDSLLGRPGYDDYMHLRGADRRLACYLGCSWGYGDSTTIPSDTSTWVHLNDVDPTPATFAGCSNQCGQLNVIEFGQQTMEDFGATLAAMSTLLGEPDHACEMGCTFSLLACRDGMFCMNDQALDEARNTDISYQGLPGAGACAATMDATLDGFNSNERYSDAGGMRLTNEPRVRDWERCAKWVFPSTVQMTLPWDATEPVGSRACFAGHMCTQRVLTQGYVTGGIEKCAGGAYQWEEGQSSCLPCGGSFLEPDTTGSECWCKPGYSGNFSAWQRNASSATCVACEPGHFCVNNVATECGAGLYAANPQQSECDACALPRRAYANYSHAWEARNVPIDSGATKCHCRSSQEYGEACTLCPSGHKCNDAEGVETPVLCDSTNHEFQADEGKRVCDVCTSGDVDTTLRHGQTIGVDCNCSPGSARTPVTVTDDASGFEYDNYTCVPCGVGYECPDGKHEYKCSGDDYASVAGTAECSTCHPSGEVWTIRTIVVDGANVGCNLACDAGSFTDVVNKSCATCPSGYECNENEAVACTGETYQPLGGQSECLDCMWEPDRRFVLEGNESTSVACARTLRCPHEQSAGPCNTMDAPACEVSLGRKRNQYREVEMMTTRDEATQKLSVSVDPLSIWRSTHTVNTTDTLWREGDKFSAFVYQSLANDTESWHSACVPSSAIVTDPTQTWELETDEFYDHCFESDDDGGGWTWIHVIECSNQLNAYLNSTVGRGAPTDFDLPPDYSSHESQSFFRQHDPIVGRCELAKQAYRAYGAYDLRSASKLLTTLSEDGGPFKTWLVESDEDALGKRVTPSDLAGFDAQQCRHTAMKVLVTRLGAEVAEAVEWSASASIGITVSQEEQGGTVVGVDVNETTTNATVQFGGGDVALAPVLGEDVVYEVCYHGPYGDAGDDPDTVKECISENRLLTQAELASPELASVPMLWFDRPYHVAYHFVDEGMLDSFVDGFRLSVGDVTYTINDGSGTYAVAPIFPPTEWPQKSDTHDDSIGFSVDAAGVSVFQGNQGGAVSWWDGLAKKDRSAMFTFAGTTPPIQSDAGYDCSTVGCTFDIAFTITIDAPTSNPTPTRRRLAPRAFQVRTSLLVEPAPTLRRAAASGPLGATGDFASRPADPSGFDFAIQRFRDVPSTDSVWTKYEDVVTPWTSYSSDSSREVAVLTLQHPVLLEQGDAPHVTTTRTVDGVCGDFLEETSNQMAESNGLANWLVSFSCLTGGKPSVTVAIMAPSDIKWWPGVHWSGDATTTASFAPRCYVGWDDDAVVTNFYDEAALIESMPNAWNAVGDGRGVIKVGFSQTHAAAWSPTLCDDAPVRPSATTDNPAPTDDDDALPWIQIGVGAVCVVLVGCGVWWCGASRRRDEKRKPLVGPVSTHSIHRRASTDLGKML